MGPESSEGQRPRPGNPVPAIVPATIRPLAQDISVVIPTVGRAILRTSLAAIAHGSVWPARLIVAAQGEAPGLDGWLARLDGAGLATTLVRDRASGRSAALNAGLGEVETRFVAITDDDCAAHPEWLRRMADHLRRHAHAVVSGRVDAEPGLEHAQLATAPVPHERVGIRPGLRNDPFVGGNVGFALSTYREVGPFDEHPSVRLAEDVDWAYRAVRAGVTLRYQPDVPVVHLSWREPGQRSAQYTGYARGLGGFYGKHLRRGDLFVAARALTNTARASRRWLRARRRGDAEVAAYSRAFVLHVWPGIWNGLARDG